MCSSDLDEHVRVGAAGDARAGRTGATGVTRFAFARRRKTVDRLGRRNGGLALSGSGGPGKNQARRQGIAVHRSRKEADEAALPQVNPEVDEVLKGHNCRVDLDGITCRRSEVTVASAFRLRKCFGGPP